MPRANVTLEGETLRIADLVTEGCSLKLSLCFRGDGVCFAGLGVRTTPEAARDGLSCTAAICPAAIIGAVKSPVETKGEGRIGVCSVKRSDRTLFEGVSGGLLLDARFCRQANLDSPVLGGTG